MKNISIKVSLLCLVDDLSRLVETLRAWVDPGKVFVETPSIRCQANALLGDLHGFFVLPLRREQQSQIVVPQGIPRLTFDFLLKCLARFIQLPGYVLVVVGSDG